MKLISVSAVILTAALFVSSCTKSEDNELARFTNGVFITNEGGFNSNNGTISFYNPSSGKIQNDIFRTANSRELGDVVQSMAIGNKKGYVVVNNSAKVEAVDMETFRSTGTIQAGFPRHFAVIDDSTGFLTNGTVPGEVLVVDLNSFIVRDTITVGAWPENLIMAGENMWVTNGNYGYDSTVSIISTKSYEVIKTIVVGDGPVDLTKDANGDIWVLCQGKVVYDADFTTILSETDSRLVKVGGNDFKVKASIATGKTGDGFNPVHLAVNADGTILYVVESDGIYVMDITENKMPAEPLISGSFNGVEINPHNGNIYCMKSTGYNSAGTLQIYTPDGSMINEVTAGVAPNGAVFE